MLQQIIVIWSLTFLRSRPSAYRQPRPGSRGTGASIGTGQMSLLKESFVNWKVLACGRNPSLTQVFIRFRKAVCFASCWNLSVEWALHQQWTSLNFLFEKDKFCNLPDLRVIEKKNCFLNVKKTSNFPLEIWKLRFTHQDDDYVGHRQVEQVEVCWGSHWDISANKSFLIDQIKGHLQRSFRCWINKIDRYK